MLKKFYKTLSVELLVVLMLLMSACATTTEAITVTSEALSPTETPLPPTAATSPTGEETPPTPMETVVEPAPSQVMLGANSIVIPDGWYWTNVRLEGLDSILFLQQDPAALQAFDDPALALPADYAAGALVVSPLPAETNADDLLAGMAESLPELSDDDLEAMLIGADRVGLINMIAVDYARLDQVRADVLAGRAAIVMDGTVHFTDAQPPILRTQVWLSWTESAFVTYYVMATEHVWSAVESNFNVTRNSLSIP